MNALLSALSLALSKEWVITFENSGPNIKGEIIIRAVKRDDSGWVQKIDRILYTDLIEIESEIDKIEQLFAKKIAGLTC